jgi:hypothetical protein
MQIIYLEIMSTLALGRRIVSMGEEDVQSIPIVKDDVVLPPAVEGEDAWESEFYLDKLIFNPPGSPKAHPHATERSDTILNTEGGTVNLQELYFYEVGDVFSHSSCFFLLFHN